jgi:hypothetical protein
VTDEYRADGKFDIAKWRDAVLKHAEDYGHVWGLNVFGDTFIDEAPKGWTWGPKK